MKQPEATVNRYDIPYNRLIAAGSREASQCDGCKNEFVSSLSDEDFKIVLLNAALNNKEQI